MHNYLHVQSLHLIDTNWYDEVYKILRIPKVSVRFVLTQTLLFAIKSQIKDTINS